MSEVNTCFHLICVNSPVTMTTAEANEFIGEFEMGMTLSLERLADLVEKS